MALPLNVNGAVFEYPENFDEAWGVNTTGWAQAVTNGMLQRQGGSFPLTADVNFGASFGLVSSYYKSRSANIAAAGVVRLSKTDTINFRNNANSADLPLAIDGSNNLTFNGSAIAFTGAVNPGTQYQLAYYATSTNAVSGLTLIAPSRALESDTNGLPVASTVTTTELNYLSGVTSALQAQINSLQSQINSTITVPIGGLILYPSATPPNSSFALADGSTLSRSTYSALNALYAGLGYPFGSGNGSTTFNIPNHIDRLPIGAGNLYTVGQTGGATTHTLSASELPSSIPVTDPGHTHTVTVTDPGHSHGVSTLYTNIVSQTLGSGTSAGVQDNVYAQASDRAVTFHDAVHGGPTDASTTGITAGANSNTTGITVGGSGASHSILNPFLAQYWHVRIL